MKYKAFLSYARADERNAKWLHNALDRYRVSRRMRGSVGRWGTIPDALHPVFRDRTDLSGGGVLSSRIEEALSESESLIVLCSSASAASKWVAREIGIFIALGRRDRIFLVIDSSVDCDETSLNASIPVSLRGEDLLAADLRRCRAASGHTMGDGRELGLQKLIAGLLGVPLNEVLQRQRDRQRFQYFLMSLLSLTFAVLAIISVTLLVTSRRSEERLRASASREAIQFLTDSRDTALREGRYERATALSLIADAKRSNESQDPERPLWRDDIDVALIRSFSLSNESCSEPTCPRPPVAMMGSASLWQPAVPELWLHAQVREIALDAGGCCSRIYATSQAVARSGSLIAWGSENSLAVVLDAEARLSLNTYGNVEWRYSASGDRETPTQLVRLRHAAIADSVRVYRSGPGLIVLRFRPCADALEDGQCRISAVSLIDDDHLFVGFDTGETALLQLRPTRLVWWSSRGSCGIRPGDPFGCAVTTAWSDGEIILAGRADGTAGIFNMEGGDFQGSYATGPVFGLASNGDSIPPLRRSDVCSMELTAHDEPWMGWREGDPLPNDCYVLSVRRVNDQYLVLRANRELTSYRDGNLIRPHDGWSADQATRTEESVLTTTRAVFGTIAPRGDAWSIVRMHPRQRTVVSELAWRGGSEGTLLYGGRVIRMTEGGAWVAFNSTVRFVSYVHASTNFHPESRARCTFLREVARTDETVRDALQRESPAIC